MKQIMTTIITGIFLMIPSSSFSAAHEKDDHGHYHGIEAIAADWVTAGYTGKAESIAMVKENMAEDGESVQGRYVGFGFTWDPRENEMRVGRVTPNSPADGTLKVGDLFLEVNGIKAIPENFESLGFRGKPGAEIAAVIERNGMKKNITFKRGIINGRLNKSQVLDNMNSGEADEWPAKEFRIIEVLSKGNTVYVLSNATQTDYQVDLNYNAYTVTRLMFNDNDKVVEVANLTEGRFILEQTGFEISR
ncbi:uncharacterized protein METZ01_LOCUS78143 [marine metagenome]|jgi:hypothetical protein|uniref:PDZ domain-containing protein n=1 Tax=marine metagenome TaxID=408172 RepID=A0A381UAX6_9ZZZZ